MSHDFMLGIDDLQQMSDISGPALYKSEVKRIPFIPREEQPAVIEAARNDDEAAQHELLLNCLNWTMRRAQAMCGTYPPQHSDMMDLVGHASLKMMEALPCALRADDPVAYCMSGRYRIYDGNPIGYYRCNKSFNKYDACPDLTEIMASKVNTLVWEDCCRVFDAIELIRETIRARLEQDVQNFLERTQGKQQVVQLTHDIANAEIELAKHPEGSYTFNLIAEDIHRKREQLKKYAEESKNALTNESLLNIYQQNVLSFLDFLSTMKGKYHEATFKEKRNALDVLGVTVTISPAVHPAPPVTFIETEKEWLSLVEAGRLAGIDPDILSYRASRGEFVTTKRDESRRCMYVHRDELNRYLPTLRLRPRLVHEAVQPRVEINYSPIFTGVQSSLIYTSVPSKALMAG